MSDIWMGMSVEGAKDDVRRALHIIDPQASLTFVDTAQELRERVQELPFTVGAIVGPLTGTLSSINVAAAVAHDGLAADVALALPKVTSGLYERAKQAGIRTVVDTEALAAQMLDELDEPRVVPDDVPTMVLGAMRKPNSIPLISMVEDELNVARTLQADSHAQRLPRGHEDDAAPHIQREGSFDDACFDVADPETDDGYASHTLVLSAPRKEESDGVLVANHQESLATQRGTAPIITFVSGRGGVGKTALVAMMATVAQSWGIRVAVCDLDLSCGNLYSCLGLSGPADLGKIAGLDALDSHALAKTGMRVSQYLTLWGPCERPESSEAVYPITNDLLATLTHDFGLVLVDTTTTFTDAVAIAAQMSDRLVITVDDRPGSVAAQARVAALAVRLGVARTRIVRLANRCGARGRGEPAINRADVGLETARPIRVLDGGKEVAECMAEGRMDDLLELGSRFADSSATALASLLSELGALPDIPEAQIALQRKNDRSRWSFGKRREAM